MKKLKYNFKNKNQKLLPLTYLYFEKIDLQSPPIYQKFHHSSKINTNEMPIYPFYKPLSQIL